MDKIVFLDFDGVLCDSEDECYASSHLARYGRGIDSVSLKDRRLFHEYRPFIRRGGDYLLLQQCIAEGLSLTCQQDFDTRLQGLGAEESERYHNEFYIARNQLLSEDRTCWLALNRLYPGIREFLIRKAGDPGFEILSTKKAEFIDEILRSKGVAWPVNRIHCSGNEPKYQWISGFLEKQRLTLPADFIDDQIDHFTGDNPAGVQGYLASWGYIRPEWLSRAPVPVVDLPEFISRWS